MNKRNELAPWDINEETEEGGKAAEASFPELIATSAEETDEESDEETEEETDSETTAELHADEDAAEPSVDPKPRVNSSRARQRGGARGVAARRSGVKGPGRRKATHRQADTHAPDRELAVDVTAMVRHWSRIHEISGKILENLEEFSSEMKRHGSRGRGSRSI